MKRIEVNTGRPYAVLSEPGLLSRTGELCREVNGGSRVLIVSDTHVGPLYGDRAAASLEAAGYAVSRYLFPAGEASKRLDTVREMYSALAAGSFTRSDLIVALGGGVTGDMAGFAAATYLRGMDFVQIPTSLLAMVDSSVGGKTGVDIPEGKNLVGAFWQPRLVIVDTSTLETLPPAFFTDGVGEIVKYACIRDRELFDLLESGEALTPARLEETVLRCIDCKRGVVERDEREAGERKLLNFGHTLGHALERYYHYEGPTHGCAVAVGMARITAASEARGLTVPGTGERLLRVLKRCGLPADDPANNAALLPGVSMDKKRDGVSIDLVILREIGGACVYRLPLASLAAFLAQGSH